MEKSCVTLEASDPPCSFWCSLTACHALLNSAFSWANSSKLGWTRSAKVARVCRRLRLLMSLVVVANQGKGDKENANAVAFREWEMLLARSVSLIVSCSWLVGTGVKGRRLLCWLSYVVVVVWRLTFDVWRWRLRLFRWRKKCASCAYLMMNAGLWVN